MKPRLRMIVPLAIAVWLCASAAVAGQSNGDATARLQAEIEDIARTSGGRVGVAVRHIESGRQVHLNGAERFPMASTFKLALAVQLLTLVDQGTVSLDKAITVRRGDLRAGGRLARAFDESRPDRTLRQLLELTLIHSDNASTDIIWR